MTSPFIIISFFSLTEHFLVCLWITLANHTSVIGKSHLCDQLITQIIKQVWDDCIQVGTITCQLHHVHYCKCIMHSPKLCFSKKHMFYIVLQTGHKRNHVRVARIKATTCSFICGFILQVTAWYPRGERSWFTRYTSRLERHARLTRLSRRPRQRQK